MSCRRWLYTRARTTACTDTLGHQLGGVCSSTSPALCMPCHAIHHTQLHDQTGQRQCLARACVHTCTRARAHTCTHAHMHTCTHAHMHTCTRARKTARRPLMDPHLPRLWRVRLCVCAFVRLCDACVTCVRACGARQALLEELCTPALTVALDITMASKIRRRVPRGGGFDVEPQSVRSVVCAGIRSFVRACVACVRACVL